LLLKLKIPIFNHQVHRKCIIAAKNLALFRKTKSSQMDMPFKRSERQTLLDSIKKDVQDVVDILDESI
jgi:hypothetical protein